MTLVISNKGVENTGGTEVTISGGQVKVGGWFKNSGTVKVHKNGSFEVSQDVINEGNLTIGDPELKEYIFESIKTAGNVAELGARILRLVQGS